MKLLTSQKNTLFEIIEAFELSPNQFAFEERSGKFFPNLVTALVFKESQFHFTFESYPGNSPHYCIYSPGDTTFETEIYSGSWQAEVHDFRRWILNLIREINAPDKWGRLQFEMQNFQMAFTDTDSNKFTAVEYVELGQKINLLQTEIRTLSLLPEQSTVLIEKLDHLIHMAEAMNKFDWKSLFIGTVISIIIQLSVTPDNARQIIDLMKKIFNSYFLP